MGGMTREWSGGDGGEIERIGEVGDEGCDSGGDTGFIAEAAVVMRVGGGGGMMFLAAAGAGGASFEMLVAGT